MLISQTGTFSHASATALVSSCPPSSSLPLLFLLIPVISRYLPFSHLLPLIHFSSLSDITSRLLHSQVYPELFHWKTPLRNRGSLHGSKLPRLSRIHRHRLSRCRCRGTHLPPLSQGKSFRPFFSRSRSIASRRFIFTCPHQQTTTFTFWEMDGPKISLQQ